MENFPHQTSIKNKEAVRDTYASDYKQDVEMTALLSAIKTPGIYQIPNVEQSLFKMRNQLKKSNGKMEHYSKGQENFNYAQNVSKVSIVGGYL